MDAKLVGLHTVKARLKDGSVAVYHYAWRGGPRMTTKPGTKAFLHEFARLTKDRVKDSASETLGWLADQYHASADFQKLRPSTRGDYERIIRVIKVKWGDMRMRRVWRLSGSPKYRGTPEASARRSSGAVISLARALSRQSALEQKASDDETDTLGVRRSVYEWGDREVRGWNQEPS